MKYSGWLALGAGFFGLLALGAARSRSGGPVLIIAEGVRYQVTEADWLWLARALSQESGDYEGQVAAAWAMVSRFCAFAQRRPGLFPTLTALVRAFSQPVNPIWSSLDACTEDGRGCCGRRCTQADIDRRLAVQARSWEVLEARFPSAYQVVQAFRRGAPPANLIPGYTNFAACYATDGRGLNIGGNCFFQDPPVEGAVTVQRGTP